MAVSLETYDVDGDVLDVLAACDELTTGLARLRRQGRLAVENLTTGRRHLDEIRVVLEAALTPGLHGETP